jgi:hypothetical protein
MAYQAAGPTIRIVREKSFAHGSVLAGRAKRGCEPPIEGRLEYISHAVVSRIVAALPGDCTALRCLRRGAGADRKRAYGLRIFERGHHCHHAAERGASDCRRREVDFVQKLMQIVCIVLERAHRHTHTALAVTALVEREYGEFLPQDTGYRGKKRQIKAGWVQQCHVWPVSTEFAVERAHRALSRVKYRLSSNL